jgi:glutamyl-tRNA synthetase
MKDEELLAIILENLDPNLSKKSKDNIKQGLEAMKPRAELVSDLVDLASIFIVDSELKYTDEAKALIDECDPSITYKVVIAINQISEFNRENIQAVLKELAIENQMKLGDLMKYIRAFITGRTASPSVFEVMEIIGKDISIKRLKLL